MDICDKLATMQLKYHDATQVSLADQRCRLAGIRTSSLRTGSRVVTNRLRRHLSRQSSIGCIYFCCPTICCPTIFFLLSGQLFLLSGQFFCCPARFFAVQKGLLSGQDKIKLDHFGHFLLSAQLFFAVRPGFLLSGQVFCCPAIFFGCPTVFFCCPASFFCCPASFFAVRPDYLLSKKGCFH